MKIKLLLISLLTTALILTGCASTSISFTDYAPAAIVCVTGNQTIDLLTQSGEIDEDAQSGILTTTINKIASPDNPEYLTWGDRLDYADGYIRSALENTAGLTLIDKDTVSNDSYYKTAITNILGKIDTTKTAPGYRIEMSNPWGKQARLLSRSLNAKSLMTFDFEFAKRYTSSIHTSCEIEAVVELTATIVDANGKKVAQKKFKATSSSADNVKVHNGRYDKDALVALYPSVIETAVNQFVVSYLN